MPRRAASSRAHEREQAFIEAVQSAFAVRAGEPTPKAVRGFLAHLCAIAGPSGKRKRGRPAEHDRDWALDQLFALAATVDGVPDEQAAVLIWLEDRFRSTDRAVPSETWLKGVEKDFRTRSENRPLEMRRKYQNSPALQRTWPSEDDYLAICSLRERKAREWLHSKELRRAYRTPGDYFLAVVSEQESDAEAA